MRKILFVASVVKMHINVFHIPTFKLLKDMGYEVSVAARNDYVPKEDMKINYCDHFYEVPFERSPLKKGNINAFEELEKIMMNGNFDIVHCHTPMGGALTRLVKIKNPNLKSKIIYTAHGFHFYKGAPKINWLSFYPIEKFLSKFTDVLITINDEDYEYSKKMYAKRNLYVPGVGIDLKKFNRSSGKDIEEKRQELGIKDGTTVLLSIGELSERKNHKVVLEALKEIKNFDFTYLICGQGKLENELKTLLREFEIDDKVKFLGFRNDINQICNASDLFIFPSIHEGLPVAVMEAMACGLPVVGSKIRGNTDLIDDGNGGSLGENSSIFYKEEILKYLNDPTLSYRQGNYNLDKIKNFSNEVVLEELKKAYV